MSETILKLENITKVYPNGVVANRNINIELIKGEIHSIVGENGAGKSTLMKIIFGIENASSGTITYKGKEVHFSNSMEAIHNGIGMVHQHFMLIPSFTVAENIILGMEPTKQKIFLNKKEAITKTQALAQKYNFDIDVKKRVSELTVGAKQKVEILKTLYRNAEIIILDEPTAVLTPQETEALFVELEKFRKMGHTIVFISHKLNEVKQISDRISIIRNGESRRTYENDKITMEEMTELIIGRELETSYASLKHDVVEPKPILNVENLEIKQKEKYALKNINFTINSGEILGIAGVQGNGQEQLIRCITGLMDPTQGKVVIGDVDISKMNIKNKRINGLAYIPEDRMKDGVAAKASISDNLISTYYDREGLSNKIFLKNRQINEETNQLIERFSIKVQNSKQNVDSLSGGNIQKVVVAREYNTHPQLMVAEQPTRGIDIGSAEYIHHQLIKMRNEGAGILLVSADLSEVMNLSDRLIVMFEGEIVAYFEHLKGVTEKELGLYMLGVKHQESDQIRRAYYETK